ncbi:hypothetical protein pb186bvf_004019 [Paramecium bursaria]
MKSLDEIANNLKRFSKTRYETSIESLIFQGYQKTLFQQMNTILQNHQQSKAIGHFHQAVRNYFGEKANDNFKNQTIEIPMFEDKIDNRVETLTDMIEQLQKMEQITYKDINYYILLCDSFLIIQLNNNEQQQYYSIFQESDKISFLLQYLKNQNPKYIIEKSFRLRQTLGIIPSYKQNFLIVLVTSLNENEIEDQKNAIVVPLLNTMYVVGNQNDPYLQVEQQQDAQAINPQSLYFELFWQFENFFINYFNLIQKYLDDKKINYNVNILDYFSNYESLKIYPKIIQLIWIIEQIIKLEIMIQKYVLANISSFNFDPQQKQNKFQSILNVKQIIPNLQYIINCQIESQQKFILKQIKDYKEEDKKILFYEYNDSQFNYAYNTDYGLIAGALVFNLYTNIKISGQLPQVIMEHDISQIFKLFINIRNNKIIKMSNVVQNTKEVQQIFYQFLGYIVYDQIKRNSLYELGSEKIIQF